MCDDWMPTLTLPLTPEQFRQLPRNPAYAYEYLNDTAYLTPRARHYHALLDLRPREVSGEVATRPIRPDDFTDLPALFSGAFSRIQPFGSLDDLTRRQAAESCLKKTRTGGDGPWIERASFVALDEQGTRLGAVFVTLLPLADPSSWQAYSWQEAPPPDAIARRLGRPHLTWIFVAPLRSGIGIGTALLAAAVNELLALGYKELLTTFLAGNDSSMLWHWRNGFRLLPHPGSRRKFR